MLFVNIFAYFLYIILIIGVILVILSDDGDSGRKLAWILVIAVLPAIGLILYLAFGVNYRGHWYFNKMHIRAVNALEGGIGSEKREAVFGEGDISKVREDFRPLAALLRSGGLTVTSGNDIEIITEGQRKFALLVSDIENAKEYIHVEYFHFGDDRSSTVIKELLMKKAAEGVKVRFLYENIANFPIRSRYYNDMKRAGVEVLKFTNPRAHLLNLVTKLNYRNHRKIVIVDGRVGYTGGMNINDHYFNLWRDTHLRVCGDAVASLQHTFLDSWLTAGGVPDRPIDEFFPLGFPSDNAAHRPDPPIPAIHDVLLQILPDEPDGNWPMIQLSYEWAVNNARKYIYLQTPYFVPPEPILNALKAAALRGVDVRVMVPRNTDNMLLRPANRSYYGECLDAGVRIYLYDKVFIHSKTFVCDDYLSSVGTANLDFRSFNINYEVNTYIYSESAAVANKGIFLHDTASCQELSRWEWNTRPWISRPLERLMRLFSPLL